MNTRAVYACAALSVITLTARPGLAQEEPDQFGTTQTYTTVSAQSFLPLTSGAAYESPGDFDRSGNNVTFGASISLPTGVRLEFFDFQACDTDPAAGLLAELVTCPPPPGQCTVLATGSTGATPGCTNFGMGVVPPHTVATFLNTYSIRIHDGGTGTATRFRAARVAWRRQVSAPPATVTFPADVPSTHPFFRFVEALAGSGITGGCGSERYCPDDAVTRGQMAVFLSTALGLNFTQ